MHAGLSNVFNAVIKVYPNLCSRLRHRSSIQTRGAGKAAGNQFLIFYISRKISHIHVAGFIWPQIHLENTLQKEIALLEADIGSKSKCRESVTFSVSDSNFLDPAKGGNLFEITAYGLDNYEIISDITSSHRMWFIFFKLETDIR